MILAIWVGMHIERDVTSQDTTVSSWSSVISIMSHVGEIHWGFYVVLSVTNQKSWDAGAIDT